MSRSVSSVTTVVSLSPENPGEISNSLKIEFELSVINLPLPIQIGGNVPLLAD